jgi:hypothetical protein
MDEVTRVLEALAEIPGGRDVEVLARRFPRRDPAGGWAPYEEWRWALALSGLPPHGPPIPDDAEDIVVTLHGAAAGPQQPPSLNGRFGALIGSELLDHWEVRTEAQVATGREHHVAAYRLTVFQNFFADARQT